MIEKVSGDMLDVSEKNTSSAKHMLCNFYLQMSHLIDNDVFDWINLQT